MGGLGNQMFQYAFGRSLSLSLQVPLILDPLHLNHPTKDSCSRKYGLDIFNCNPVLLSEEQYYQLFNCYSNSIKRWWQRLKRHKPPVLYKENQKFVDPNISKIHDHFYLIGYWQSERYFHQYMAQIKSDFAFKTSFPPNVLSLARKIKECNSVCIHVRRGDTLNNPLSHNLDTDYYQRAIKALRQSIPNLYFFVFSDDIFWCKKNLQLTSTIYVSDKFPHLTDKIDFQLMTLCKHFIIPNSTFAWWAAWLAEFPEKKVYVPDPWHINPALVDTFICPAHWIKISL